MPQNWSYVGSWWSIGGMVVTLLPETVYPFVYIWAHRQEKAREQALLQSRSAQKSNMSVQCPISSEKHMVEHGNQG